MTLVTLVMLAAGGLWLLLANGPISLDLVTPWLAGAIAENFGNHFNIDIGGTVLERDEHGRTAMRVREIKVRDHDGTVIASAPKAEVGFSSVSLLTGSPRAQRLNLVGAELAIRVETDGRVSVSAGSDERPLAVAPAERSLGPLPDADRSPPGDGLAALLAWIDSLTAFGLDGGELTEVGLKSGNLLVDDRRNGQQSRFENIHLILTRPDAGQLEFEIGSDDPSHPWLLLAAVKPGSNGNRVVDFEARQVMLKDMLLALRVDGGQIDANVPVSARLRAELAPDGIPRTATGRIEVGQGSVVDVGDPEARITIDHAELHPDWDADRGVLTVPLQLVSGGTRLALKAKVEPPADPGGSWVFGLEDDGLSVLAPVTATDTPLTFNRVVVQSRIDPASRQVYIDSAEVAGKGVGVTMSGSIDCSTSDPRLKLRLATRNLPLSALKQMWPAVVTPPVREWVIERTSAGLVEQGEIVTDAPVSTLRSGGPPVPDGGLAMRFQTIGVTVLPFDNLPEIRDADLLTLTRGSTSKVKLARGTIQMLSGRSLAMSGELEVPDTSVKNPPAKVRAKVDGPVAAAAELLNMERLRGAAGVPIDPTTSRGNATASVNLGFALGTDLESSTMDYAIAAEIANFSADRLFLSQNVEAQVLHASANNQGFQLKGDMRVGGAPATVELRRAGHEPDAELRLTGTLDDAARTRFGFDVNGAITGPVGVKIGGRLVLAGGADSRLQVEADFTQARFDNVVPGWSKAPRTPARATFTYGGRGRQARLDDVTFDGNGASIRGAVELDQNGEFATGTFPVFALAEGDRSSLQLARSADNLWKATLRGDTFDGRNLIKSSMSGAPEQRQRRTAAIDFDVEVRIGAVAGFKGEVLRNLDTHLVRRGGTVRSFAASARFAGDGLLQGELRGRPGSQQTLYLESNDAGALFRLTDTYSRMFGGRMWIAMDAPNHDSTRQEGLLDVRDFVVRGEPALDGVAAGAPVGVGGGVPFSGMRVRFTRQPGKMTIHEGLVTGPVVGGTIDGVMDYGANELHLRGTFVPLYELNAALGNIPVLGFFLGGKEGLIGSVNYEVVGSPGAPALRVNPISAVAPGFVRKFLEFPSSVPPTDRFAPSSR